MRTSVKLAAGDKGHFAFIAEILRAYDDLDKSALSKQEMETLRQITRMLNQAMAAASQSMEAQTGLVGLTRSVGALAASLGAGGVARIAGEQAKEVRENARDVQANIGNVLQQLGGMKDDTGLKQTLLNSMNQLKDMDPKGQEGSRVVRLVTPRSDKVAVAPVVDLKGVVESVAASATVIPFVLRDAPTVDTKAVAAPVSAVVTPVQDKILSAPNAVAASVVSQAATVQTSISQVAVAQTSSPQVAAAQVVVSQAAGLSQVSVPQAVAPQALAAQVAPVSQASVLQTSAPQIAVAQTVAPQASVPQQMSTPIAIATTQPSALPPSLQPVSPQQPASQPQLSQPAKATAEKQTVPVPGANDDGRGAKQIASPTQVVVPPSLPLPGTPPQIKIGDQPVTGKQPPVTLVTPRQAEAKVAVENRVIPLGDKPSARVTSPDTSRVVAGGNVGAPDKVTPIVRNGQKADTRPQQNLSHEDRNPRQKPPIEIRRDERKVEPIRTPRVAAPHRTTEVRPTQSWGAASAAAVQVAPPASRVPSSASTQLKQGFQAAGCEGCDGRRGCCSRGEVSANKASISNRFTKG